MLGISCVGQVALGEIPSDGTATAPTSRLPLFHGGYYWRGIS